MLHMQRESEAIILHRTITPDMVCGTDVKHVLTT